MNKSWRRACLCMAALALLLAPVLSAKPLKVPRMITLDEEARIFAFENFLTDFECDHLIRQAKSRLRRSSVRNPATEGTKVDDIRTSSGMFFRRGEDRIIARIEERIARWSLLPSYHGEGLQVLLYKEGEKYDSHYDFITSKVSRNGGNRVATVIMYLNDVEEGGETVFPNILAPGGDNGPSYSDCARYSLAVKPRKGTAVLFHSIKPSAELEPRSFHRSCPVIKGEKWCAPKWLHVGRYAEKGETAVTVELHPQSEGALPPGCVDKLELCPQWAGMGECSANAVFMVGSPGNPGNCIKSCRRCDIVAPICEDQEPTCAIWASQGECDKNPNFMVGSPVESGHCLKSCGRCGSAATS